MRLREVVLGRQAWRAMFAATVLSLSIAVPAFAVNPDERLDDPALEARARELSAEVRCMVCQNQSIDDSNADLARDLRVLIRDRITAGDSNEQVLDYLVDRYGEFVLLKPRFSLSNFLLWAAPLLGLIGGLLLAWRYVNRRGNDGETASATPLSAEEQAKITKILDERD